MKLVTSAKGWRAAVTFTSAGIVGPLLALLDMTLSSSDRARGGGFLSELTFLLWPAQVLGLMETSLGPARAGVIALVANVALFWGLGLIVHFIANDRLSWGIMLIIVTCTVAGWELWGAGWNLNFVHWSAMAVALVFYSGFLYFEAGRSSLAVP